MLRALEGSGIGAPRALWLDVGRWVDRPSLVMHREPGICEYDVVNGHRAPAVRARLAREFCDLLAADLDWRALGLDAVLPDPGPCPDRAAQLGGERRDQVDVAELDLAIEALRAALRRRARTPSSCTPTSSPATSCSTARPATSASPHCSTGTRPPR